MRLGSVFKPFFQVSRASALRLTLSLLAMTTTLFVTMSLAQKTSLDESNLFEYYVVRILLFSTVVETGVLVWVKSLSLSPGKK